MMSTDDPMPDDTPVAPAVSPARSTGERASKVAKRNSGSKDAASSASASALSKGEVIHIDGEDESTHAITHTQTSETCALGAKVAPMTADLKPHHIQTKPIFTSASYEYVDRSVLAETLVCGLCTKPLVKPLQHKCGTLFCQGCLQAKKDAGAPATCTDPDCKNAPIRSKDLVAPAKAIVGLLDSLQVKCPSCQEKMARSAYESHWTDKCDQPCPFAADGCEETRARSLMNEHIDTCAFMPVNCDAKEFGCDWAGQREAQSAHQSECKLYAVLPTLSALQSRHTAELNEKLKEIAMMQECITTTNEQLKSYKDLYNKDHSGASPSTAAASASSNGTSPSPSSLTPMWRSGTIIDALDTENSWLIAKILRIDLGTKHYLIHYIDWDSSWDEQIPFGSPRLAPGGTHTTREHVEKHVRKVVQGGVGPGSEPIAPATQDVLYANNKNKQPATTTLAGKNKRKAN